MKKDIKTVHLTVRECRLVLDTMKQVEITHENEVRVTYIIKLLRERLLRAYKS